MTIFLIILTILSCAMGTWTFICTLTNRQYFKHIKKKAKKVPGSSSPLISVIIPARDEEKNLGRLLESLTKQSYRNIEVLVINDGSTDHTQSIIEDYEKKDSRIKGYLSDPNVHYTSHGKMNALLQVIPKAKGEYFLCTDADTYEKEDCIESALRLMETQQADIISGFPAQHSKSELARLITTCMVFATIAMPVVLINLLQIAKFSLGIGQFVMMRRSAYEECGGYEKVKYEVCDDLAIIKSFMRQGKKYIFTTFSDHMACNMYETGPEAFRGLERSICNVFPSTVPAFLLIVVIVTVLFSIYWAPLATPLYFLVGRKDLLCYMLISWLFGKIAWYIGCRDIKFTKRTSMLSTSSITCICVMYLHGMWIKITGRKFDWKGRKV